MSYRVLKSIDMELSTQSINNAIREIRAFQEELKEKCLELVRVLADEGVKIAKMQVISMEAVDTGELERSIEAVFFPSERCGVVIAGCAYAVYVEYGTGVVAEREGPHPSGEGPGTVTSHGGRKGENTHAHMGYGNSVAYDSESGTTQSTHSEMGWVYKDKAGQYHFTRGFVSRPFMYNTLRMLEEMAPDKASEILT